MHYGSDGRIVTKYDNEGRVEGRYRLSPYFQTDNPELLAQGRFQENARIKREANSLPWIGDVHPSFVTNMMKRRAERTERPRRI